MIARGTMQQQLNIVPAFTEGLQFNQQAFHFYSGV